MGGARPVSGARADRMLEAPGVIEIRCSRPDFVIVVTDGMQRAIRGRDGALQVEDGTALAGAITRTGDGAQVRISDLPPQAARIIVYLAAGKPAELDVLADGALRARHVVAGPEAREALVLRRTGSSWTLRAPARRLDDLAEHLAGIGALGAGAALAPNPAPPPRIQWPADAAAPPPAPGEPIAPAPAPNRGRRRVLVAGSVLAVAGAAAAFAISSGDDSARIPQTGAGGGRTTAAQTTAAQTRSSPTSEDEQQARQVKEALVRLPDDPAALLPAEGSGQTAASARAAVPEGTTVAVDERTWAPDGLGGGVVQVTLRTPDGERTPYVAVMVQEQGEWKVLSTVPVTK